MTGNGRVPAEEVEGIVESVNRNGLKLGGAWVNVSQFHPIELPEVGDHVRMKIDSKGYIISIEKLSSARESAAVASADKDERITRLAVLKAAAQFVGLWAQTREEIRSEHVLMLADKWLAWVKQ